MDFCVTSISFFGLDVVIPSSLFQTSTTPGDNVRSVEISDEIIRKDTLWLAFVYMWVRTFNMSVLMACCSSTRSCSAWIASAGPSHRMSTALRPVVLRRKHRHFAINTLVLRTSFSSNFMVKAFMEGSASTNHKNVDRGLSRTAVRRMRVGDLRQELAHRKMDTSGTKKDLVPRLLQTLNEAEADEDSSPPIEHTTKPTVPTSTFTKESSDCPKLEASSQYILQVKGISSLSSNKTGVGLVLIKGNSVIWEARKCLSGDRTLFEAEYTALVLAVRYAVAHGAQKLTVHTDHETIQKQLTGTYEVRKESLKPLYWALMSLKESVHLLEVERITSQQNERATELAERALATAKSVNIGDCEDPMSDHEPRETTETIDSNLVYSGSARTDIDPSQTYQLQFDGGARRNPNGIAGAGMVLYDQDGKEIWCGWKFLECMSNNAAEYWALLLGLQCARSLGIRRLVVLGDSELIIKQLLGIYRVRDAKLYDIFVPTKSALDEFEHIELKHVFRADNQRADWLANHAMDTLSSHGFDEVV